VSYQVELNPDARRTLRRLARADQQTATRIVKTIDQPTADPRPSGAKALAGSPGLFRVRVGDYRVVYAVENDRFVVLVVRVGHRRDVYR
jgi:mRNA interferase RelE/StbE